MQLTRLISSVALYCATIDAAAITGISIVNNSSADHALSTDAGRRLREFRTSGSTTAPTSNASSVFFDARFSWMSAHRVNPGGPDLVLTHGNSVAWDLLFTVEDPLEVGYTLDIDSLVRGYVTAAWESNTGVFPSLVFSSGTLMSARLDSGSGFGGLLTDIMPPTEVAFATATDPFVNQLVSGSGTYHAGSFSGTRNFVLRFGTITSNTSGALQNFNTGEADVRFGLDSTMSGFLYSAYPGSDGENAAEHGQFITVTATFNESPSEVPEPATLALTGAALIVLARKRLVGSR